MQDLTGGRIERLLDDGVAVVAATVDQAGFPSITRGWGPRIDHDSGRLELALTAPSGSAMQINLDLGGRVAITFSEMTTYWTVQVKGSVHEVRSLDDSDRTRVDSHLARFVAAAGQLGIAEGAANFFLGDLLMVSMEPERVTEQTPGPNAGRVWQKNAP